MGVDVDVIAGFRSKDIVILEDEYKRKIHLFHKLGFVLSDSVPIS